MLAPSTVMLIGRAVYTRPMKLFGPRQMPAPPCTSMASITTRRMCSVSWYFTMAEATAGFSPTPPDAAPLENAPPPRPVLVAPADDPVHGNEHIAAPVRAVLERAVERVMTA